MVGFPIMDGTSRTPWLLAGAYRGRGIRSSPVEFTGTRRLSDPEGTRPVNAGVPVQKIGHGSSDV